MHISHLDHLVITTKNLEECLHFYHDLLGMETEEKDGRYALHFGNEKINIHTKPAEFLPAAENPTEGSLDLCLVVKEPLSEVYEELQRKDAPFVTGIVIRNGAKGEMESFYLRDPDGNLIEISAYPI